MGFKQQFCLLFSKEQKVKISTCNPSTCEEREFEAPLGCAAKPASTIPSTQTPSSKKAFFHKAASCVLQCGNHQHDVTFTQRVDLGGVYLEW